MQTNAAPSVTWGEALAGALGAGEFALVYQPKARLDNGALCGFEALLRWNRDGAEVAPVSAFLPLLESSGQIVEVGHWALREACRQAAQWREQGVAPVPISVNVSSIQLADPAFFEHVKAALYDHAINPRLLELEITESCLIDEHQMAMDLLSRVRGLGARISLDDFGTGFSSLGRLGQLPVDTIKIDRAFVRDMTANAEAATITRAILSLARNLRLDTIAEGVETEGQLARLVAEKCGAIQGYLYSRPLTPAAALEFMRAGKKLDVDRAAGAPASKVILLVDDEPNVLSALRRLLRREGYVILTAGGGAEALDILAANRVDVVISDQRMPAMTGVEFLRRVKDLRPEIVRMVLSGFTDLESITQAINEGAIYKFLTKPWDDDLLRSNVVEALRRKEITDENRRLAAEVRAAKEELEINNRQLRELVIDKSRQMERDRAALRLSQDLVQQIPFPIVGVDRDGLVAFANATAERVLGTRGPLLGSLARDCLPGTVADWLGTSPAGPMDYGNGAEMFSLAHQAVSGDRGHLLVGHPVRP